jgi:hypothetical protein
VVMQPSPRVGLFAALFDVDQNDGRIRFNDSSIERIDWIHVLSLAATLALSAGVICILLFAM